MIEIIDVWLNAFIPRDVSGATTVANGIHAGKQAIRGPAFDYFLTDNRGFDATMSASSRMSSRAVITFEKAYLPEVVHLKNRCDATVKLDGDGDVTCNQSADTGRMQATGVTSGCQSDGRLAVRFRFVGSAANACISGSPDIDWNIAVSVFRNADLNTATIEANGVVEPFPAFEMYARARNGPPNRIFGVSPLPGASPFNLFGGPTRNVGGSVYVSG